MRRWHILALTMLLAAQAQAYYFFTHYTSRTAPYNPVPEKFDLASLPNNTVTFFVSDQGPASYTANDSFASVLSQIRQAAQTWNSVSTSTLRVAFGGLYSSGTPQNTPVGQVQFVNLPPGVLGYGGVSSRLDISASSTGNFYPIQASYMHLSADLTKTWLPVQVGDGPSYTDEFFLSTVHEMGHALGLQHTFTSSAMSQSISRATTLARPIDADDIAGLSVLYPTPGFAAQFGTITGRVQFTTGAPVHMASVVAIRSGQPAISAYTNPDGTFTINGVPQGVYFIYAHPLPPDANANGLFWPLDPLGNQVTPSAPFNTVLYPGVTNFTTATPIQVSAGSTTANINFTVQARASVPLYDLIASTSYNGNYLQPAFLNENNPLGSAVARGVGLGSNGVAATGLNAQVLGGTANIYASLGYGDGSGNTYLAMYLQFGLGGATGPQHLIFSLPDFTFVLPSGVNLATQDPPSISSIGSNPDGSLTFTGTNFASDSRFFLDGYPLTVRSVDPVNGIAVITPPPAASGQRSTACVANDDGQNSFFAQQASPATFTFPVTGTPSLVVSPTSVPAGSEAMVDITGTNTNFVQSQILVGFGSSDVFVRRVFVLSPTHLQVDVSVRPAAAQTFTEVSVLSGMQWAALPYGFQIGPQNPLAPVALPSLVNSVSTGGGIYPGAMVSIFGTNLSTGTMPTVTFNGNPAAVLFFSAAQINVQLPSNLPSGPVQMVVSNGQASGLPVDVNINSTPAAIVSVLNAAGTMIDAGHPAKAGDTVMVLLSNFADPSTAVAPGRVQLMIGNTTQPAYLVAPYMNSGLFQVETIIPSGIPAGAQNLVVYLDGNASTVGTIYIGQ